MAVAVRCCCRRRGGSPLRPTQPNRSQVPGILLPDLPPDGRDGVYQSDSRLAAINTLHTLDNLPCFATTTATSNVRAAAAFATAATAVASPCVHRRRRGRTTLPHPAHPPSLPPSNPPGPCMAPSFFAALLLS